MAEYNHEQTGAGTTWTITHNLGTATVAVDTFIDNGGNLEKILPLSVEHTNNNTLTITFSVAQTGRARIVTTG